MEYNAFVSKYTVQEDKIYDLWVQIQNEQAKLAVRLSIFPVLANIWSMFSRIWSMKGTSAKRNQLSVQHLPIWLLYLTWILHATVHWRTSLLTFSHLTPAWFSFEFLPLTVVHRIAKDYRQPNSAFRLGLGLWHFWRWSLGLSGSLAFGELLFKALGIDLCLSSRICCFRVLWLVSRQNLAGIESP